MTIDVLLARLTGVKHNGPGRWIANCPAHSDRTPSLSIRELDNGRVLVNDFAGCPVEEVLSAIDLSFDDLYPPRPPKVEGTRPERRPWIPSDVFEIARRELGVLAIIAADIHKARTVSESDYQRLFTAVQRLNEIAGAAYGR